MNPDTAPSSGLPGLLVQEVQCSNIFHLSSYFILDRLIMKIKQVKN